MKTQLFSWMKGQNDILDDNFGNLPIISAPMFKLDQNKPPLRTNVPKALQNLLKHEDYYVVEHWLKQH
ncbi:hypothetical protein RS130_00170 [Paraglaciecola aquimarina]|uniref:Uncharacterized protein n=1 Tax=Paraglaciecola aquimarina TaxID=1235557 RepID=A0ABU3SR99_9ALTE|nr:hypothetical protein [Paraglaciecola aquimarina]MDU0352528.1 hypothetical protein [Paraglaciecola aquimarina]